MSKTLGAMMRRGTVGAGAGLLMAFAAVASPDPAAAANPLVGVAAVVDGDTLELDGVRIELYGIDAPEIAQTCTVMLFPWKCGLEARKMLRALVAGREVSCLGRPPAPDTILRAVCKTGGVDLNETMVRIGMALASRDQSDDYVSDETAARGEEVGVWLSRFDAPWDWRAAHD